MVKHLKYGRTYGGKLKHVVEPLGHIVPGCIREVAAVYGTGFFGKDASILTQQCTGKALSIESVFQIFIPELIR